MIFSGPMPCGDKLPREEKIMALITVFMFSLSSSLP